jgi:hypothetical protein
VIGILDLRPQHRMGNDLMDQPSLKDLLGNTDTDSSRVDYMDLEPSYPATTTAL